MPKLNKPDEKEVCICRYSFAFLLLLATLVTTGQDQLLVKEFKTAKGIIRCTLPGGLVRGDRIWTTVTTQASGTSVQKTEQNAAYLSGCKIHIGDQANPVSESGALFTVPDQTGLTSLTLEVTSPDGKLLGKSLIPVSDVPTFTLPAAPGSIHPVVPQVAEKGFPGKIAGSFDGDASTTYLMIGDQEALILAESPRECWFLTPEELSGIRKYSLKEGDQLYLGEIRVINLALTASRTNLRRGEKTAITIEITGLDKAIQPVHLEIENQTPGVLSLEGGNKQTLEIGPSSLAASGIWEKTLSGQSVSTGEFTVQVNIVQPPPAFILPLSSDRVVPPGSPLILAWNSCNLPPQQSYELNLYKGVIPPELLPGSVPVKHISGINGMNYTFPDKKTLPEETPLSWQVITYTPGGIIRGVPGVVHLARGADQPKDTLPAAKDPAKDPCKDPWYVALEEEQCQEIINEVVKPGLDGVRDQFSAFQKVWKDHFRELSLTMSTFDMRLGMLEYWMGTGKEVEENAEKVQALANLIGDGVDKGITAFKEGGEEALKEVVKGVIEDKVKEAEQNAASRLSEDLGTLYDLKDIAVRNIGLGIAKGLTGVYPDRKADFYRRAMEISITELSGWISHAYAWNNGNTHPTLQQGIAELNRMLNQLDQVENDFDKAVSEAGFKCISCKIPPEMMKEINKLRMQINEEMRKFGDTIDRITQRLNDALAAVNNKRAYEDVARLGFFQGHSAKKTREIKRVLSDCRNELREANAIRR